MSPPPMCTGDDGVWGLGLPKCLNLNYLNRKITACFIMTGEIMGGENMAELVQNRPFFPVIILPVTSASQIFSLISKEFTSFFLSQMHLPALMINDDI